MRYIDLNECFYVVITMTGKVVEINYCDMISQKV